MVIFTSKGKLQKGRDAAAKECARQDQGIVGLTKGPELRAELRGLQPMGMIGNILLANCVSSIIDVHAYSDHTLRDILAM